MSLNHHGEHDDHQEIAKLLKKFQQQEQGTKPREFPHGRISGDDDGELVYKVGSDPEKELVLVDFGKPVNWLGMGPQQAIEFAQSLIKHARAVSKTPVSIVLH